MADGNLFQSIPNNLDEESFQVLAQSDNVKVERIVSKGHSSPRSGWYDQDNNEWVVVLSGAATIHFDDGLEVQLKAGDYIDIAAHKRHKLSWTDPDVETIWLAVHY